MFSELKHKHRWNYMFSSTDNEYNWFYCTDCLAQTCTKIDPEKKVVVTLEQFENEPEKKMIKSDKVKKLFGR